MSDLLEKVMVKAQAWQSDVYDKGTRDEVERLMNAEDKSGLIDAFYKDLAFGTGGLRGIMGAGTNRMNIYTVGSATQGLCNYLKSTYQRSIKVGIAYDCRNNSSLFARKCAEIFSANGIEALLFESLRPTPELSFLIREYACQSGIVITASHNPKEYNGYKVYWEDGAQVVAPHDGLIIQEVGKIKPEDVNFNFDESLIRIVGEEVDSKFIEASKLVSINPDIISEHKDIKIVYTPIHGTGVYMVPKALRAYGFINIFSVDAQNVVSGDFPTVESPNPEEVSAMQMALDKGKDVDADVVLASDPDADRIGVACKNDKGEFVILNGNQTLLLFLYYILNQYSERKLLKGNEFVVKTIVTTELVVELAKKFSVKLYDVYTGFKYIARIVKRNEGKLKYIGGGEESFGFMPSDFVRDKDAVTSCALMAEITAWAKHQEKSLYDVLRGIYTEHSFSYERMKYVVRKGQKGESEIKQIMDKLRNNPPAIIFGDKVRVFKDFQKLEGRRCLTGEVFKLEGFEEPSNVLQFFTDGKTKITVRPSGTEPKIKFYFEMAGDSLDSIDEYDARVEEAELKIDSIMKELGL
ncbi:MAG: phospho-sugar mutase [Bacteroidales bacterium]